jgi:DNA polymerase-3 subunit alpha
MKPQFIEGGQKNGHKPEVLEKIWGDWEKFAEYAFNKSHATSYSLVAYQTAYLKAYYPAEYMAAVLSRNLSDITEITKFMDESKAMGILVLGPDVNESNLKFTVNSAGNIRFGLGAIKGVGEGAVLAIVTERKKNGAFKDIFDFVQRVNLNACGKKNIESLALAGAFDGFSGISREQFFAENHRGDPFVEVLVRYGNSYQVDKQSAGNSLFGGMDTVDIATPEIPFAEQWGNLERLNKERELIGIYLSAHPLNDYDMVLEHVCNTRMAALANKESLKGMELKMGGMVTHVRRGIDKKGIPYGIVKLEDYSGFGEIPFFGNEWVTYQGYMHEGIFLYIKARCHPRQWKPEELELRINSIELLPDVKEKLIEKITISVPLLSLNKELISDLSALIREKKGETALCFAVTDPENQRSVSLLARPVKLSVDKGLITYLKEHPELSFHIN